MSQDLLAVCLVAFLLAGVAIGSVVTFLLRRYGLPLHRRLSPVRPVEVGQIPDSMIEHEVYPIDLAPGTAYGAYVPWISVADDGTVYVCIKSNITSTPKNPDVIVYKDPGSRYHVFLKRGTVLKKDGYDLTLDRYAKAASVSIVTPFAFRFHLMAELKDRARREAPVFDVMES